MTDYCRSGALKKEVDEALSTHHPLVRQLLYRQGVRTEAEAAAYLAPSYDAQHDPFLLPDMVAAVERITEAMAKEEKITIFSDYDCDGIPGAVVLADFFAAREYKNTAHYIPHRHFEGFGLSVEAVEKIAADGTKLIITIDCGTGDSDAVARATALGVDVIITDHHEPKEELPKAVAIVNPRVGEGYPFPHLCGAGVIFKLVQALLQHDRCDIGEGMEKWWLDMVGIATLADMVPLTGENRTFAHFGLTVLRKSRRPGLQQLLQKQRASQRHLTEDDIGFTIGPRINAASRMDAPEDALQLLTARTVDDAAKFVDHLEALNTKRKTAVAQMTKVAHAHLKQLETIPSVIVLGNPDWRPSLAGLVANKLAEEHGRPAFVWGRDGNGVLKGSCRGGGSVSVVTLMEACADSFLEYGGHHASGGFSVKEEKIHTLSLDLEHAMTSLGTKVLVNEAVVVDGEIALEEVTPAFAKCLQAVGPFGMGNPKPLLLLRQVTPQQVVVFGKTKEHTKITFHTETGDRVEAIAFFRLPQDFITEPKVGESVDMLVHLEQSFFAGRLETRLRVVECGMEVGE